MITTPNLSVQPGYFQLADQLATSIRHIRRLVAERRVPYVKVGRLVRFDPTEITAWLDSNRHSSGIRFDRPA